jgi:type IV pilus assembly protein PilB
MTGLQRKKIGALLLEAGLITPAQLEKALVARGGQKMKLGKIMVELGYLSEAEIAEVLSSPYPSFEHQ